MYMPGLAGAARFCLTDKQINLNVSLYIRVVVVVVVVVVVLVVVYLMSTLSPLQVEEIF